jgi:hypothetical protein
MYGTIALVQIGGVPMEVLARIRFTALVNNDVKKLVHGLPPEDFDVDVEEADFDYLWQCNMYVPGEEN